MSYVYYQPNPHDCKDCGVRALMCVSGRTWFEIFDRLTESARRQQRMHSTGSVIAEVAQQFGFPIFEEIDCKMTVAEFAQKYHNGDYLVGCEDHIVCVKDGNYYDAFDSGDKLVKVYAPKKYMIY